MVITISHENPSSNTPMYATFNTKISWAHRYTRSLINNPDAAVSVCTAFIYLL